MGAKDRYLIVTVGTSLLENIYKDLEKREFSCGSFVCTEFIDRFYMNNQSNAKLDIDTFFELNFGDPGEAEEVIKNLGKYIVERGENSCAEFKTIKKLRERYREDKFNVVFFSSDTVYSEIAGKALKIALETMTKEDESWTEVEVVGEPVRVKNLDMREQDVSKIKDGLLRLYEDIVSLFKEYTGDVIFAISGGYKIESVILTLAASFLSCQFNTPVKVAYIYEDSDTLLEFEPLRVKGAADFGEVFLKSLDTAASYSYSYKKAFVTVGTSLLTNFSEYNRDENVLGGDANILKGFIKGTIDEGRLTDRIRIELRKYAKENYQSASAELQTLSLMLQKHNYDIEQVVLVSSDTQQSKFAANFIKEVLENKLDCCKVKIVTPKKLKAELQSDSEIMEALGNYINKLYRESIESEETNIATKPDEYVLVASGSFKAVAVFSTILSTFYGVDIIYNYEESPVLIHLPIKNINFDLESLLLDASKVDVRKLTELLWRFKYGVPEDDGIPLNFDYARKVYFGQVKRVDSGEVYALFYMIFDIYEEGKENKVYLSAFGKKVWEILSRNVELYSRDVKGAKIAKDEFGKRIVDSAGVRKRLEKLLSKLESCSFSERIIHFVGIPTHGFEGNNLYVVSSYEICDREGNLVEKGKQVGFPFGEFKGYGCLEVGYVDNNRFSRGILITEALTQRALQNILQKFEKELGFVIAAKS